MQVRPELELSLHLTPWGELLEAAPQSHAGDGWVHYGPTEVQAHATDTTAYQLLKLGGGRPDLAPLRLDAAPGQSGPEQACWTLQGHPWTRPPLPLDHRATAQRAGRIDPGHDNGHIQDREDLFKLALLSAWWNGTPAGARLPLPNQKLNTARVMRAAEQALAQQLEGCRARIERGQAHYSEAELEAAALASLSCVTLAYWNSASAATPRRLQVYLREYALFTTSESGEVKLHQPPAGLHCWEETTWKNSRLHHIPGGVAWSSDRVITLMLHSPPPPPLPLPGLGHPRGERLILPHDPAWAL